RGAEAAGNRAAHVLDVQRHLAEFLGQVVDGELQPGLGVDDPAEERQHQQQEQPERQGRDLEPALDHNLGEKLRCRRGPGRSELPGGMVSACATSMPTDTTGRRRRMPMPTEYMSGSPQTSKALPVS